MRPIFKTMAAIAVLSLVVILAASCASPAPAPSASPSPSAKPTSAPAPAPTTKGLVLEITPIMDGAADADTKVTVKTSPGASCTIKVTNPVTGTVSSYPTDKTKTADASGTLVWSWHIPAHVTKGDGSIEVTATLGSETLSKTAVFRVITSTR